mgnify:CR=1 FL=1
MFHAASAQKYVDASTLTIIGRTCPMAVSYTHLTLPTKRIV